MDDGWRLLGLQPLHDAVGAASAARRAAAPPCMTDDDAAFLARLRRAAGGSDPLVLGTVGARGEASWGSLDLPVTMSGQKRRAGDDASCDRTFQEEVRHFTATQAVLAHGDCMHVMRVACPTTAAFVLQMLEAGPRLVCFNLQRTWASLAPFLPHCSRLPATLRVDDPLLALYAADPDQTIGTHLGDWIHRWKLAVPLHLDALGRAVVTSRLAAEHALDGLDDAARELMQRIDVPVAMILGHMEATGIAFDGRMSAARLGDVRKRLASVDAAVRAAVPGGSPVDLLSPQQVAVLVYDRLKLGSEAAARRNKRSTSVAALEALPRKHPVLPLILEYRALHKVMAVYMLGLQRHVRAGAIHTSWHAFETGTGRLSSVGPNLQNLPRGDVRIDAATSVRVRDAFTARDGFTLVAADYRQIEARVLAHLSDDAALKSRLSREAGDLHASVARVLFGRAPDEPVPDAERKTAKTTMYAVVYGQSPDALARTLKIGRAQAASVIGQMHRVFARLRGFGDSVLAKAHASGHVTTMDGRRRLLSSARASGRSAGAAGAERRKALNTTVQGSAADVIKRAMVRIADLCVPGGALHGAHLLAQIHDELLLEVPTAELARAVRLVRTTMEADGETAWMSLPLPVHVSTGRRWGSLATWADDGGADAALLSCRG